MSGDDHDVNLDDLLTDEAKWRDIAEVAEEARVIASGVEKMPDYVTDGLSYAAGFQTQYDEIAGGAVKYLTDGVATLADVADRLRATYDTYVGSEDDAESEAVNAEWA